MLSNICLRHHDLSDAGTIYRPKTWTSIGQLGLLGHASVLGAELFNAAGFNDAGLSAGVEGVAFRRGIKLEERIGHAVDFNGFLGLHSRVDDEGLVDGQVDESDRTVFGMNVLFHFLKDSGKTGFLSVALFALRNRLYLRGLTPGMHTTCRTERRDYLGKLKENQESGLYGFTKLELDRFASTMISAEKNIPESH